MGRTVRFSEKVKFATLVLFVVDYPMFATHQHAILGLRLCCYLCVHKRWSVFRCIDAVGQKM